MWLTNTKFDRNLKIVFNDEDADEQKKHLCVVGSPVCKELADRRESRKCV